MPCTPSPPASTPAVLLLLAGQPLLIGPLRWDTASAAQAVYGDLPDLDVIESLRHLRSRIEAKDTWPPDADPRWQPADDDPECAEALRRELLTRAAER